MERNKRNALVHLLATQCEYRKPGSRNSNQSNCATNKSKVVSRLYGSRLCFAYRIVNGVVIGRRVIASTRRDGRRLSSLPTGIQSELGLHTINNSVEVVSIGAILVSEPSSEGIAFLGRISRLYHFATNGNKLRVNCGTLVGFEINGNRPLDTVRAVSVSSRSIACRRRASPWRTST